MENVVNMGEKVRFNFRRDVLNWLLLLGLLYVFNLCQLTVGSLGQLNGANVGKVLSWQSFSFWMARDGFMTLKALLFIYLGATIGAHRLRTNALVKTWLSAIAILLTLSLVAMTLNYEVGGTRVFDSLFIVSRNAFPMVTGLLIFVALAPYLTRLLERPAGVIAYLAVLVFPLIGNHDLFLWGNGISLRGVILLCTAGLLVRRIQKYWQALALIGTWLIGALLTAYMGWFSSSYHGDLATMARFIGIGSPFVILPAVGLAYLLMRGTATTTQAPLGFRRVAVPIALATIVLTTSAPFQETLRKLLDGRSMTVSPANIGNLMLWALELSGVGLLVGGLLGAMVSASKTVALADRRWGNSTLLVALEDVWTHFGLFCKQFWQHYWHGIVATCVIAILQAIAVLSTHQSLQMVNLMQTPHMSIFWFTFILRFLTIFFSSAIILLVFWFILALTDRYWLSLITVSAVSIVLSIATNIKIGARSEPIIPADLAEITSLGELLQMVSPVLLAVVAVGLVVLIGLIIVLERKHGWYHSPWYVRVWRLALPIVFFLGFQNAGHPQTPMHNLLINFNTYRSFSNQLLASQENGLYLQFAYNIDVVVMAKPKGYSKAAVTRIYDKYKALASSLNQTRTNSLKDQTFIFNLSEAFSDPQHVPELTLNEDPISKIRALADTTTYGYMMSYGYGGGTANMEFESLTGLSLGNFDTRLSSPYSQLVENLKTVPNISQGFDYSSAVHPFVGTFYNRIGVYKKFGLNKFVYQGSGYKIIDQKKYGSNKYLSDKTAYANALKQLNARDGGQFLNLITIQNHYPYPTGMYPDNQFSASGSPFSDESKTQIATYAKGLHYTDNEVVKFMAALDKIDKPITWVFYGDHLPASIYDAVMGPKTSVQMHETVYFVYSNKYARAHGAKSKLTTRPFAGTNDFIAMALTQANVKVNAYTALLTEVEQQLPTPWIKIENSLDSSTYGMRFINNNGSLVHYEALTKAQKQLLNDYQIIQYDITVGKQYSQQLGMHP